MIGALIGLGFGLLWFMVGAGALGRPAGPWVALAGIVLFAIGAARVLLRRRTRGGTFIWYYYVGAVVAEVAGIVIVQNVPAVHGRTDLLVAAVGIVVGLHFVGLKLATGLDRFLLLSAALVLINCGALLLPFATGNRTMFAGFGSAAALFLSATV